MTKRLYRSRRESILGGVCGGLGEYFEIDPNLVRILFILFGVLTGFGILVYFALWLILPEREEIPRDFSDRVQDAAEEIADRARSIGQDVRQAARGSERGVTLLLGAAFIMIGVGLLLRNLGILWMGWFTFGRLWPIFPILIGLAFLWRWLRGGR